MRDRVILGGLVVIVAATAMWGGYEAGRVAHDDGSPVDYPIRPVPFTDVHVDDAFWTPFVDRNRSISIPFAMQQNEETGRVANFARAGGLLEGLYEGERYNDTDVYKVLEGASYSLRVQPDPELEARLDGIIATIAAAQEEDGYLFTPRTAPSEELPIGIGEERWSNLPVSHELYNAGHMYEAAVAHFLATGKRTFLDVAVRNADLVVATFGPGPQQIQGAPGHQEIEIGLAKLYRVTGDRRYLDQARYFLDQRGRDLTLRRYPEGHRFAIYNDPVQIQAQAPVLEQDQAVGHAVRAMYMYAGMADVAALTGDADYVRAIDRLWEDTIRTKMYLTGALGARHETESFGERYELPTVTGYGETCASIGSVFWNHRLFLLHGDGKYLDVLERTLYNGLLAGVSLSGDRFFYPNPLEADGEWGFNQGAATRQPWFGTACCPGNMTRFLPGLPGYVYATDDDGLFVNLFVGSEATVPIGGQTVTVRQRTGYPWNGDVRVAIEPLQAAEFSVRLRMPGWAVGRPVPSDLYRYAEAVEEAPSLAINGQPQAAFDLRDGFVVVRRLWQPGDYVELSLPMPVHRVLAHRQVADVDGRVAIERGPLVYAVEAADNHGHARDLRLPPESALRAEMAPDLLGGLQVVRGRAYLPDGSPVEITAIPYYAWSNRGPGAMAVWLPARREGAAGR